MTEEAKVFDLETEGTEGFEGTVEFDGDFEETHAVTEGNGNKAIGMFMAGLATGSSVGAAAWFLERRTRLEILNKLEEVTFIANAMKDGKDTATYKKKEVSLAGRHINSPEHLIIQVQEGMDKAKFLMTKKERKRWKDTQEILLKLAAWAQSKEIAESGIKKELHEGEVEELKDDKPIKDEK